MNYPKAMYVGDKAFTFDYYENPDEFCASKYRDGESVIHVNTAFAPMSEPTVFESIAHDAQEQYTDIPVFRFEPDDVALTAEGWERYGWLLREEATNLMSAIKFFIADEAAKKPMLDAMNALMESLSPEKCDPTPGTSKP